MSALAAWVLALMVSLASRETPAKWAPSYDDTANAIASASQAEPLFAGDDGPARTAATLVALSWEESRFDPNAVGDHGRSVGLFQINRGWAPVDELRAPDSASRRAIALLRESFRVCRARPLEERAAWFAAGGAGCPAKGYAASRRRVGLGMRLFREMPPPRPEPELAASD